MPPPTKAFPSLSHWFTAVLFLWLTACGSLPDHPRYASDGAPAFAVDINAIPAVVPHQEARSRYGNPRSYVVGKHRYHVLSNSSGYKERGIASWYGTKFHGRRTSIGEPYDMLAMTAAHKTLPLPTYVEVTNLNNGRKVIVRINDRGPFKDNRIIDLSYAAATKLGIAASGTGLVEVRALDPATYQHPRQQKSGIRSQKKTPPPPGQQHSANRKTPPANAKPLVVSPAKKTVVKLYLQIGAFAKRRNALDLQNRLRALSPGKIHIISATAPSGSLFRVHMGPFANVREVDRITHQIASMGLGTPHVVIY